MSNTKNNLAWEKIFDEPTIKVQIENNNRIEITSDFIKQYREPRLMTKFDCYESLPPIFNKHKYSILPITRGSYTISDFNCYHTFESCDSKPISISPIPYIETLSIKDLSSESLALNYALLSDIFQDFLKEDKLYQTISGRMSSGEFDFNIDTIKASTKKISVKNSQIEIDSSLESPDAFYLIEAKNILHENFIIRQLYYPFRKWKEKITKPVRLLYVTFSNGIYKLYLYEFQDMMHYNSIKLIKSSSYAIEDSDITFEDIKSYMNKSNISSVANIPFPQADKFERIINLCEILNDKIFLTKNNITEKYQFDPRQTDYYTNACLYLNLIEKYKKGDDNGFILAKETKKIFENGYTERTRYFIQKILQYKIFDEVIQLCFNNKDYPQNDSIVSILNKYEQQLSASTKERRSKTVQKWIKWIFDQVNDD